MRERGNKENDVGVEQYRRRQYSQIAQQEHRNEAMFEMKGNAYPAIEKY